MQGQDSHQNYWNSSDQKPLQSSTDASVAWIEFSNDYCDASAQRLIERRARDLLEQHPHFHGRSRHVHCKCSGKRLVLSGKVPTYFLKQLAQESLRDLVGFIHIDNRITVASPIGEVSGTEKSSSQTQSRFILKKPR